MRWPSFLRHCATSRKVASSIPEGITENFHLVKPPGCAIDLEQKRERGVYPKGKGGRCVGLTLPPSYAECLKILGASTSWKT